MTTTTTTIKRYDIAQVNGRWVVVDTTSAQIRIVTDQADLADITNPDHHLFFGLSQSLASTIAKQLNG